MDCDAFIGVRINYILELLTILCTMEEKRFLDVISDTTGKREVLIRVDSVAARDLDLNFVWNMMHWAVKEASAKTMENLS